MKQRKVLGIAASSATGVLGAGIAESVVRDQLLLSTATVALGAGLFFAVLLVQLVKPQSFRLACSLAVIATTVYALVPAAYLLRGASPDYLPINTFSSVVLLSFVYSFRGIAAALAGLTFVLLLVRRGVVHPPQFGADTDPEPAASPRAPAPNPTHSCAENGRTAA